MMSRQSIELNMKVMDVLQIMSEGNPGAINVLINIIQSDEVLGFMHVLSLDDMNIRGTQIWIGFKDHCKQDINKFIDCIKNRDQAMVDEINKWRDLGNHTDTAVTGRASERSFKR